MTIDVLANAAWHSLCGAHVTFAEGSGSAVRYRPDVAVFHAAADDDATAWDDLRPLAVDGLVVLFREPPITPPPGWERVFGGVGHQMVLDSTRRDVPSPPAFDPATGRRVTSRLLTDEDVEDMVALVALTEPGPFRPRTIELGGYVGIFHDRDLVAMAGRRLRPPGFGEVSAVCTHPEARRRGYAATVSAQVATAIAADGDTPFLHVAATNTAAQAVYEQLGFTVRREVRYVAFRPPRDGASPRSSLTAVATDVGSSRQIAGSAST